MPPGSAQPDFFMILFVPLVSLRFAVVPVFLLLPLLCLFLVLLFVGFSVLYWNHLCPLWSSVGILFLLLKQSRFIIFL